MVRKLQAMSSFIPVSCPPLGWALPQSVDQAKLLQARRGDTGSRSVRHLRLYGSMTLWCISNQEGV